MEIMLAVILIIVVIVILALAKGKGGSREYTYQRSKYLLSKAERSFYGVLVQAIGSSGVVFSKVRVADLIAPTKGLRRSDWQRAFNAISAKHFDFIVCKPTDLAIKLAVELDDSSHGSSREQKRDDLLNGACQSAGLPLLRIKAAKSYSVAEVQRLVEGAISSQQALVGEGAAAQPAASSDSGPATL